jgi:hypothetical protein
MLYVDYNFDLENNTIMLDSDMRLEGYELPGAGGRLPEKWKDGDLWMMKVSPDGRVVLHRKPD